MTAVHALLDALPAARPALDLARKRSVAQHQERAR